MRTTIYIVIFALAVTLYGAGEESMLERTELKRVMKSYAVALELIQHGIIYNNTDEMHKGAQLLRSNENKFLEHHGAALASHMPDQPEFVRKYAKTTSARIRHYTDRLNGQLGGKNDYSQIATSYSHILQECVGCHQKIRQW